MIAAHFLSLALLLLVIGVYGVLTRRNIIGILLAVEVILNAANLNFITFARWGGADPVAGSVFPVFVMAISACEMAVALAIIIAMYRQKKNLDVNRLRGLHG